jgi:hypothetical protein
MATIETLEADIDKLKADVKTLVINVGTETTPKTAEGSAAARPREGEVKTIAPTEYKDQVKTPSTKADEPVSAAKPKEGEAKPVASTENKDQVKTPTTKADEPVSAAKPKEGEAKPVASAQDKARDGIEKAKTGVVYISKAKFWITVCLAFLFGVAVGTFICTYATRSSPPSSNQRSDEAATR